MDRLRMARAEGAYERWERRTDKPLLVLAVVFIAVLVVPYFVALTPVQQFVVSALDIAIWLAFAVDYVVRLYLAPQRWVYVRTHVLDLLVVVIPMLRPLRVLRIVRLTRLGALVGMTHTRAERAFHVRVAAYVLSTVATLVVVAAVAMNDTEGSASNGNIRGFGDALWWAIATVTTVGYGDRYPTTATGRVVAAGLMIAGIALVGVVTAAIATWFVDRLRKVQAAEQTTTATLADVLVELHALRLQVNGLGRPSRPTTRIRHGSARDPSHYGIARRMRAKSPASAQQAPGRSTGSRSRGTPN